MVFEHSQLVSLYGGKGVGLDSTHQMYEGWISLRTNESQIQHYEVSWFTASQSKVLKAVDVVCLGIHISR